MWARSSATSRLALVLRPVAARLTPPRKALPRSGTVTVVGQDLGRTSESELARWRSRHIGLIFQLYNLVPVLSAWENAEFVMLLQHVDGCESDMRIALIDITGDK